MATSQGVDTPQTRYGSEWQAQGKQLRQPTAVRSMHAGNLPPVRFWTCSGRTGQYHRPDERPGADLHVAEPLNIPDGHDGACIQAHTAKGCGWKSPTPSASAKPSWTRSPASTNRHQTNHPALPHKGSYISGNADAIAVRAAPAVPRHAHHPGHGRDQSGDALQGLGSGGREMGKAGNSAQNPARSPSSGREGPVWKQQHIPGVPFFSRAPDAASGRPLWLGAASLNPAMNRPE